MTDVYEIYSKGFSHHQQGELEEAESYYNQALTLNPEDLNSLFMMANLKFQQYRFKEAENYILKAINLAENIRFYDLLTRIRIESKQFKTARIASAFSESSVWTALRYTEKNVASQLVGSSRRIIS